MQEKARIFLTVKTYPTLSKKYIELVCTAGIRDDGTWIRLYPIPFRFLKKDLKFKKYSWIELEIEKNASDWRSESYNPCNIDDIKILEEIGTDNNWHTRKHILFNNCTIYKDIDRLIHDAKSRKLSLAIFKPKTINKIKSKTLPNIDEKKKHEIIEYHKQDTLFHKSLINESFNFMPSIGYSFHYEFTDVNDKKHTLRIIDWEIGQLYLNTHRKYSNTKTVIEKVKQKYIDIAQNKDVYFFLVTSYQHHLKSKNPFMIIGVFYPPIDNQLDLF